MIPSRCQHYS